MPNQTVLRPTQRNVALLFTAALLFVAVASGGCAAAGMAAIGPFASAIEALADRTVERTLPGDLPRTSSAAFDTVSRLGFNLRDVQRGENVWTFEAANEKVTVHGQLTPLSPSLTRLALRVEIGSFAADKSAADEILNQIWASLADSLRARAPAAANSPAASRLAEIEAELQRLRVELEATRTRAEQRPARDELDARQELSSRRVPGIISIPASYGVPTVPAPRPLDSAGSDRGGADPLIPVNRLSPVQPVTATENGGR